MIECDLHQYIRALAYTDLVDLEGVAKSVYSDRGSFYFPQRFRHLLQVLLVVAHLLYWDVV